ncbi:unnamed protein product, partial [Prorocentrum cordatum]
ASACALARPAFPSGLHCPLRCKLAMVLLEDVNPRDMEALERQAQSDLKWRAKMEAELASIDRRDKISGILQRLEGSDSEVEEVLGEAAMEVMEQEDLQAEEKWVRQVEEARRRRQQLKQIAARVEESRSARDTAAKRRHAMATDALDNPPWLE